MITEFHRPLRIWALILAGCVCLWGLWYLKVTDPESKGSMFAICAFNKVTNLHCPGCGSTRAGHDLLNFRFLEAAGHNLFFVLSALILPIPIFLKLWRWANNQQTRLSFPPGLKRFIVWLPALVITFSVLRNIPVYPFSLLAP